jgi:hypothetical protein
LAYIRGHVLNTTIPEEKKDPDGCMHTNNISLDAAGGTCKVFGAVRSKSCRCVSQSTTAISLIILGALYIIFFF